MDTLSIILIIAAVVVVWKDKDDLWRYILVAVAAGYFSRTPAGNSTLNGLNEFFNWVFRTVQGWLS